MSIVSAAALMTLEERHRIEHPVDRFHEHHQTIDSNKTVSTSPLPEATPRIIATLTSSTASTNTELSLQPLTNLRRSQGCAATFLRATPVRIEVTDLHQRCCAVGSNLLLPGGKVAAASRTTRVPALDVPVMTSAVSAVAEHRGR